MGICLAWLAFRDRSADELHAELGLAPTGRHGDFLDFGFSVADLPNGWRLVFALGDVSILDDGVLASLSRGGEIVTCFVEEHVMASQASFWRDGVRIWRVDHESERGERDLRAEGEPPVTLAAHRERALQAEQAEEPGDLTVDYIFDVPVNLAAEIVGYRHDEVTPGLDEKGFREMTRIARPVGAKRPWWRIW